MLLGYLISVLFSVREERFQLKHSTRIKLHLHLQKEHLRAFADKNLEYPCFVP